MKGMGVHQAISVLTISNIRYFVQDCVTADEAKIVILSDRSDDWMMHYKTPRKLQLSFQEFIMGGDLW
jgi:hypothetical protein